MRRAQSVRHNARPSVATFDVDDLGVLREESGESIEDVLRRQLLEKDREIDKLKTLNATLQTQLNQRPPLETVSELKKEFRNLELILEGTQRENARAMGELERVKTREKEMLERALAQLAGENWQSVLDINSEPTLPRTAGHHRPETDALSNQPTSAHIQQIRMLVMGMEQRLQEREELLSKEIQKAEAEKRRFDELRRESLIE